MPVSRRTRESAVKSRVVIALAGAAAIHALAATVLKRSIRYTEIYIPGNSIEIVTEGTSVPLHPGVHSVSGEVPTPGEKAASSGAPGPSVSAVSGYLGEFRDRLSAKIRPPRGLRSRLQLVLKVTLLETGDVKSFAIDQSSGSPDFDQSVLEALSAAKPFPPFSKELAETHELSLRVPIVLRAR